ncbi:hypothetical protein FS837_012215 [Tulasnella sp. UAMH 9824]|nr:hypothetical protein FS837_012215 [Tulasnella sp. UAMH 9824]
MSQTTESHESPPRAEGTLNLSLDLDPAGTVSDAEFLRNLYKEGSGSLSGPDFFRGLIKELTLRNAYVIEGLGPPSPSSESADSDNFDPTDETYWEPWNAVKTYHWLYGRLSAWANAQPDNELLSRLCNQVEQRLESARRLRDVEYPDSISEIESPTSALASLSASYTEFGAFRLDELPPEILGKIFILACKGNLYMPLHLSEICTYSRDVAVSTPQLWTNINSLMPPQITSKYLERSKALPISVDMTMIGPYPFDNLDAALVGLQEFFTMIRPHGKRIQDLVMVFTEVEHAMFAFAWMEKLFLSSLEFLEFGVANIVPTVTDRLSYVPNILRTLLKNPSRCLCARGLEFPQAWEPGPSISTCLLDLRISECAGLRPVDLAEILSCTPSLKTLTLYGCKFQGGLPWGDNVRRNTVVHLPELTKVEMHWIWPPVSILSPHSPISTPNLKHVTAAFKSDYYEDFPQSWLTDLSAANPQLSSLDVTNCVVSLDTWTTAFRNWHSMSSLRTNSCEIEDQIIQILSPSYAGSDMVLPNLQRLTFDNELKLSSSTIEDIVCERHSYAKAEGAGGSEGHGVALREVTLRGWDAARVDESDVIAIKSCVERFNLGVFNSGMSDVLDEGSESDGQSINGQSSNPTTDDEET